MVNKQKGKMIFEFNTYTIAVMVIVVQQRELRLPNVDEYLKMQKEKKLPQATINCALQKLFQEFLLFYGNKYDAYTRSMSPFLVKFFNVEKDRLQQVVSPSEQM